MPTRPGSRRLSYIKKKAPQSGRYYSDKRYHSVRWRRTRAARLKAEPYCRECKSKGIYTPARVLDHIVPVRLGGDFWLATNHQPLCDHCHNVKSAKESREG